MPYKDKEKEKECKKKYQQRPEVKAKAREYYQENKEYYREYNKKYQQENKDKLRERAKKHYQENKEKLNLKTKKYYQENKQKLLKQQGEYYKNNTEHVKNKSREYSKNNRGKINKRARKYSKKKRKTDKNYNIKIRIRCLFRMALKTYTKTGKIYSCKKYGIDWKKVIEHLKPFPKNISKYHIDHIKPLCSFDLENPEEIKIAFAPENHQWLLAEENMIKGGDINNRNI